MHDLVLAHLIISTCFGHLWAHHEEKQLCLCDTLYLLFCADDCLACRSICSCIPDSHPHRIICSCIPDSHPHRIIFSCIPDSHPHTVTTTKCHINTVVSPNDEPIGAQNMKRLLTVLRINCEPSWLYLQDYTEMHGQQNVQN